MAPSASILFPTRRRRDYLAVALASVAPQAVEHGAEVIVVEDDPVDPDTEGLVWRHGGRYFAHGAPRGINVARNTAIDAAYGSLLCFLDDDVEVWPDWLAALLAAAEACPEHEAFGGPIRPRLEGTNLHACGRESLPVTALDLGAADLDAEHVWGANMALRRGALERIGRFDPALGGAGDEEDWQRRLRAGGGRIRYVARAGVDHRRVGDDARLGRLARAGYARGRFSRRYDARKGAAPSLPAELRTLAGCVWHTGRYRCGNGIVMAAHTAGRVREAVAGAGAAAPKDIGRDHLSALSVRVPPNDRHDNFADQSARLPPDDRRDYLSGESGTLSRKGRLRGAAFDLVCDLLALPQWVLIERAARRAPRRRVLVLCVARPENSRLVTAARRRLEGSRHDVDVHLAAPAPGAGKWANLNAALAAHPPAGHDWLLLLDDDVALPRGFLDRFLPLAERSGFRLAQPAHRFDSHAAWRVTRRRPGAVARRTRFVEIGPVTAIHADAFAALLPFPDLQMGWGLDAHWGAVAEEHGWAVGVIDATPIRHTRPVASDYLHAAALAEADAFLAQRPYVPRERALETLATYRRLR
jgi:GT2 family glycosyltransferase